jgi:hypothetical protein
VRHVRMLGLCLMALLAMAATTAVVASPALASCNEECKAQKEKEKQEAKEQKAEAKEEALEQKDLEKGVGDPWGVNNFKAYKYCPWEEWEPGVFEQKKITYCFNGITLGGKHGGFFEYGHIKVPLSKSVRLQGGFKGNGEEIEVLPAANGGETLEAPPLPVEGGIKVITPLIQQEAEWPQALKEAFKEAEKNGEKAIDVKIEMAGNECYEVPGCLDTENIIIEEGTAFKLPLKVKVTGPFLEKLGGGSCEIGSDTNPIHINLTTEDEGTAGELEFNETFTNIFLQGSRLVDFGWHISKASGATGCGGSYESYVDKALNLALEVESPEGYEIYWRGGIVVLQGDLHTGSVKVAGPLGEKGEL